MISYHIVDTDWKTLKGAILQAWLNNLTTLASERKDLQGAPTPHRELTIAAVNKQPPNKQRGIIREISQAFQLENQKAKWAPDATGVCVHCPSQDSRKHRQTACAAMEHVYQKHPQVHDFLLEMDDIHCNLPVVYVPNHHDFHQWCFHQQQEVCITSEAFQVTESLRDSGDIPVFFSDGSALHPEHSAITRASWSLVLSTKSMVDSMRDILPGKSSLDEYKAQFVVAAISRCHGRQSIDRAELSALVYLHEQWHTTILITDSNYAIYCWQMVGAVSDPQELLFRTNSDLLLRLFAIRQHRHLHTVLKVKSHQWNTSECFEDPFFFILGNEFADMAAKKANNELHTDLVISTTQMAKEVLTEWDMRCKHYSLITDLHEQQTIKSSAKHAQEQQDNDSPFLNKLSQTVAETLKQYEVSEGFVIQVDWPHEVQLKSQWTSEVASAFLQFWATLTWPNEAVHETEKLGISWGELCLLFLLDRNLGIPTAIPNTGIKIRDMSQLMEAGCAFYHVIKSFYWMASWLNKALGGKLFEGVTRGMTKALQRQGSTNRVKGFLTRPSHPLQSKVVEIYRRYFQKHGRFGGMVEWPLMPHGDDFDLTFWYHLQVADADT